MPPTHLSPSKRIMAAVAIGCLLMALVDIVIKPGYLFKSLAKLTLFLGLPWLACYRRDRNALKQLFTRSRSGLLPLLLGVGVYALIVGLFLLLRNVFDFSMVSTAMDRDLGVDPENFAAVALYISFVNSLLEEFFFRGFAFLTLRQYTGPRTAMVFSAVSFALYHVAMMIGWFQPGLILLLIAGLTVSGWFFNCCDRKSGTLYPAWFIHISANFATNTVGFLLLGML